MYLETLPSFRFMITHVPKLWNVALCFVLCPASALIWKPFNGLLFFLTWSSECHSAHAVQSSILPSFPWDDTNMCCVPWQLLSTQWSVEPQGTLTSLSQCPRAQRTMHRGNSRRIMSRGGEKTGSSVWSRAKVGEFIQLTSVHSTPRNRHYCRHIPPNCWLLMRRSHFLTVVINEMQNVYQKAYCAQHTQGTYHLHMLTN